MSIDVVASAQADTDNHSNLCSNSSRILLLSHSLHTNNTTQYSNDFIARHSKCNLQRHTVKLDLEICSSSGHQLSLGHTVMTVTTTTHD